MTESTNAIVTLYRRHEAAFWLLGMLFAAVFLRFLGLDFQSYWYDELFSAHISNPRHDAGTVIALTLDDVHPPFYQLMMWLSYKLFGYTEWAGRFPSALAGVLTIPVIYLLGRELLDARSGAYAAAFAVVNYYLLYYAQEARSYAFLYFFCCLSFLLFARALRSPSSLNLAAYIVATLLLVYTHYFGFVLIIAEALCAICFLWLTGWSNPRLYRRAAIAAVALVVGTFPLVPSILGHADIEEFWITQPNIRFLVNYFLAYFYSLTIALAMLVLLALAVARLFLKQTPDRIRFGLLALFIWVAVGYAVPWLRGFVSQPVITDRNTIMVLPPLLLLASAGLRILPWLWLQRAIAVWLVCFSLYFLTFQLDYYGQVRKNQFREIAAAMSAYEPPLPVYTLKFNDTKYNVYFTQQGSPLEARDAAELEALLETGAASPLMWLADGHGRSLQTDLDERFGLVEVGRLHYSGTIAVLWANPASATRLELSAAGGQREYFSGPVDTGGQENRLLVSARDRRGETYTGRAQIDAMYADGRVLTLGVVEAAEMPVWLEPPDIETDFRLRVTLLEGQQLPDIWLMSP